MSGRDRIDPRGGLSVLGLVSPTPGTTEPWDLLVMSLSVHFAGPGIREVTGQKREQAIMSTALTERTKQRIFAYFKLAENYSSLWGPRVILPLGHEWSGPPSPWFYYRVCSARMLKGCPGGLGALHEGTHVP